MTSLRNIGIDREQGLDLPGFAQEFLRRCPTYRDDYLKLMQDPDRDPASEEEMARKWGLCFPGRSRSHSF